MTTLFRANKETILATGYKNMKILPKAESFPASVVNQVLAQTGCQGLRIYYGMDPTLKVHAILVGYDATDKDILPPTVTLTEADPSGLIVERGVRCPDTCPPPSVLNP